MNSLLVNGNTQRNENAFYIDKLVNGIPQKLLNFQVSQINLK